MGQIFKSTWHKMRELVILSLNIIYIKNILQQCGRMHEKLEYTGFTSGPVSVIEDNLNRRKHELNKRMKNLLEEIMNSSKDKSDFCFNIEQDHACLTKKQLEKGYALYTNIRNVTYALDLRKGALLPILDPESNVEDNNLRSLEYTAHHDGPVYEYFEIDTSDPLKNNIRY